MPFKPITTAIAGYGAAGEFFHAPFIASLPEFQLTTVLERHKEQSKVKFPEVRVVKSFSELVHDQELELIVITTPNEFHFSMAKEAMENGKHVVVDKPMTVTSSEAEELIRVSRETGKLLTVYQNRRLDAGFLTVKKIKEENGFGKIRHYEAHFDRYRPAIKDSWREKQTPGGGLLYDLGVHLLDQTIYLWGKPQAVTARIERQRPEAVVDDFFEITLQYNGFKAIVTAGMLVEEKQPQLYVEGAKMTYFRFDLDPQEAALKKGLFPKDEAWEKETVPGPGFIRTTDCAESVYPTERGNYPYFYKNLARGIREGGELLVKPEEAWFVIRLIELARISSEEKRTIELSNV
jgi:scyllo-inositol 2-dehydrogenase (NADP+)